MPDCATFVSADELLRPLPSQSTQLSGLHLDAVKSLCMFDLVKSLCMFDLVQFLVCMFDLVKSLCMFDLVQFLVSMFDLVKHLLYAQSLYKLADQLKMRRLTVLEANFDRPPYNIPASRQVPKGWTTLRQFVQVEHPQYAHIIDNKLMDMVRGCGAPAHECEVNSSGVRSAAWCCCVHCLIQVS
jgi:hypothetical protein